MARNKKPETEEKGEQLDLIDVAPKNAKLIIAAARLYKRLMLARLNAGKKEVEQKTKVLELVRAAKLKTLDDGKVRFEYDGVLVSVTPRDALVQVKDKSEDD